MNFTKKQIQSYIKQHGISKAARLLNVSFYTLKNYIRENNISYEKKQGGRPSKLKQKLKQNEEL